MELCKKVRKRQKVEEDQEGVLGARGDGIDAAVVSWEAKGWNFYHSIYLGQFPMH